MRLLTTNKFFRCFRHILLLLPMMFVLASCAYVIANPNAKDSYYGDTINEEQSIFVNDKDDLVPSNIYYLQNSVAFSSSLDIGGFNQRIYVSNFEVIINSTSYDLSSTNSIGFYLNVNNGYITYYFWYGSGSNDYYSLNATQAFLVKFAYVSNNLLSTNVLTNSNSLYYLVYNQYSYLSNVFEYGMYQFNNVGFGKFDFMSWFVGIFNDQPNVYTDFLNSYFNYYLLVEIVAFAPSIIHLFVHLVEGFIEKISPTPKEDD